MQVERNLFALVEGVANAVGGVDVGGEDASHFGGVVRRDVVTDGVTGTEPEVDTGRRAWRLHRHLRGHWQHVGDGAVGVGRADGRVHAGGELLLRHAGCHDEGGENHGLKAKSKSHTKFLPIHVVAATKAPRSTDYALVRVHVSEVLPI